MEGRHHTRPNKPLTIWIVNADDLGHAVIGEIKTPVHLVQMSDSTGALERFQSDRPALVICGVDRDGGRFNPMFLLAARRKVPVIVAASTKEAIGLVEGVSHFIDRRAIKSIAALSQKLLEDPEFIPKNLASYPPPPRASDLGKNGPLGVKVTKAQMVSASAEPQNGARDAATDIIPSTSNAVVHPEAHMVPVSDLAAQLVVQSQSLKALRDRVNALEDYTRTSVSDNGKFINAVAAESATFYSELKESIATASAKNSRAIDTIRTMLNDAAAALPPADRQLNALQTAIDDVKAEGVERQSNFEFRIDALVQQITKLESDPPPAAYSTGIGNAQAEVLSADFDKRIAEIERTLTHLQSSSGNVSGKAGFTEEFEDLWNTQTTLNDLQKRVQMLEQSSSAPAGKRPSIATGGLTTDNAVIKTLDELKRIQVSLKNHIAAIDQRFSGLETMVTELERRTEVIAKIPQAQFSTFVERLGEMESALNHLKESFESQTGDSGLHSRSAVSIPEWESLEIRLKQLEMLMRDFEHAMDVKTLLDESELRADSSPPSQPPQKGTIRAWKKEVNKPEDVVQRSIFNAKSSAPPTRDEYDFERFKRDTGKVTLIGVESPKTNGSNNK